MCTILFSWKATANYRLILIANRDEFYKRETKNAHWWDDHPEIYGGRDLQAGGTWMGINKNGRFATITNYRKFPLEEYDTSRGDLVKNYLIGNDDAKLYMKYLKETGKEYDGYNLIFGNSEELLYYSNRGPDMKLKPSIYGLSNHLLDTPWPKVSKGKTLFTKELEGNTINREQLFGIVADEEIAEDHLLPDTGIGLEKERFLSSIFIKSSEYGTRLSTFISVDKSNKVVFHERSFVPEDERIEEFVIE